MCAIRRIIIVLNKQTTTKHIIIKRTCARGSLYQQHALLKLRERAKCLALRLIEIALDPLLHLKRRYYWMLYVWWVWERCLQVDKTNVCALCMCMVIWQRALLAGVCGAIEFFCWAYVSIWCLPYQAIHPKIEPDWATLCEWDPLASVLSAAAGHLHAARHI